MGRRGARTVAGSRERGQCLLHLWRASRALCCGQRTPEPPPPRLFFFLPWYPGWVPKNSQGSRGLGPRPPLPWGLVCLLLSRFPFQPKVSQFSRVPAESLWPTCLLSQPRGSRGLPGTRGAALPEGPGRPSVGATPCPLGPSGLPGQGASLDRDVQGTRSRRRKSLWAGSSRRCPALCPGGP